MNFTNAQWLALLPILLLSTTIVVAILAVAFRRHHRGNATCAVIGLNLSLLSCVPLLLAEPVTITSLLVVDGFAAFYMVLILATTLATATLSHAYLEGYDGNKEEMYLLLLLAALGAIVLACSQHLTAFFIGLELMSVPLYAMVAYPRKGRHALEAGLKYLVLSAVASAFLVFGMALIYAQTGTLLFSELALFNELSAETGVGRLYLLTGSVMLLLGVAFKLSLVPFHLWTPDVYEGAPAPVAAFLATASKVAVFAVLLRYFEQGGGNQQPVLLDLLSVLAVASILAGNLLALRQSNVKRMLAYSSIAHFGYCLVGLIATGYFATEAVGIYLLTYVVTTLGAFGVVTLVSSPMQDRDADHLYDYRGLFWRRPYLTSIMTAMLLSLAGIPLTAGFIGKFYVIAAGMDARAWILVGAVVVGSAIGLYYYLRLLITLFMLDPQRRRFEAPRDWAQQTGGAMVWGLMILMLLIGIFPQPFIWLVQRTLL